MPDKAVQTHTQYTLHTQQMVASTGLGDHPGRPSIPVYRSYVNYMMRYKYKYPI